MLGGSGQAIRLLLAPQAAIQPRKQAKVHGGFHTLCKSPFWGQGGPKRKVIAFLGLCWGHLNWQTAKFRAGNVLVEAPDNLHQLGGPWG